MKDYECICIAEYMILLMYIFAKEVFIELKKNIYQLIVSKNNMEHPVIFLSFFNRLKLSKPIFKAKPTISIMRLKTLV